MKYYMRAQDTGTFFPTAPIPDVILGSQKDTTVLRTFKDVWTDAVNACLSGSSLGERLIPLITPEVNLAASFLYHYATLLVVSEVQPFAGQTLGDEYCGIVLSRMRRPFSRPRRIVLVLILVLLPYAWSRCCCGGYMQILRTFLISYSSCSSNGNAR